MGASKNQRLSLRVLRDSDVHLFLTVKTLSNGVRTEVAQQRNKLEQNHDPRSLPFRACSKLFCTVKNALTRPGHVHPVGRCLPARQLTQNGSVLGIGLDLFDLYD